MSDETPTTPRGRRAKPDSEAPEVVETPAAAASDGTTAGAPVSSEPSVAGASASGVVYVHAPVEPAKRGNRGFGIVIAVISTVIFLAVYALVIALINGTVGGLNFSFLSTFDFYWPAIFFLVGFIILVVIVNRAAWWAFILGSLLVALFVYFGTVGVGLLENGAIVMTPEKAGHLFTQLLVSPYLIAAALVAREVAIWMGSAISARGRRLKVHNAESRRAYEEELAAHKAEYDKAAAAHA